MGLTMCDLNEETVKEHADELRILLTALAEKTVFEFADIDESLSIELDSLKTDQDATDTLVTMVGLCEDMISEKPTEFIHILPPLLRSLCRHLVNATHYAKAATAAEKAVAVSRTLGEYGASFAEKELASSLWELGNCQGPLNNPKGILDCLREAVLISRRVIEYDQGFEPYLATYLQVLARFSARSHYWREAISAAEEAIAILRPWVVGDPEIFEIELASSLMELASVLDSSGWNIDALEPAQEAIGILRERAENEATDLHKSELCEALRNYSRILLHSEKACESVSAAREDISISKGLVVDNASFYAMNLVYSFDNLVGILFYCREWEEALFVAQEGARTCEEYYGKIPSELEGRMAYAYYWVGLAAECRGELEKAQQHLENAIDSLQSLPISETTLVEAGPNIISKLSNISFKTGIPLCEKTQRATATIKVMLAQESLSREIFE